MSSEPTANAREAAPPPEAESDFDLDLRPYVAVLWSYKWLILLVTVLVTAAVAGWTIKQPKIYEATAVIEYDPNTRSPLGNEVEDVSDPIGSYFAGREFFATQNRVIASRAIAERVVTELGLHQDASFFNVAEGERDGWQPVSVDVAAASLQARLEVAAVPDTRLVEIKVTDQDPERAAMLANAIADAYIQKTLEDRMGSTVSALEWLGTQLDTLRGQLETSELALHQFKSEHNILSVSMEDRQNLVASDITTYNGALTKARTRRIELQARAARLAGAAVDLDEPERAASAFPENPLITGLLAELRVKRAERDRLGSRYARNHQQMVQLDAEIASLRRQLEEEISGVVRAARADVAEFRRVESGLSAELDRVHDQGLDLNLREIEYQRLNRQRQNNSKLYDMVLERTTETDLTRMVQNTHVRMLDRALAPAGAISPNLVTNVGGGLGAGIALALALAFLLSRLDRRLKSVSEVEALGLSVLGILPRIDDGSTNAPEPAKRHAPLPDGTASRDLFVHTHPMSAAAECCRTIRTNLTFMSADEPIRAMVITSASPREGKTTVTTNVAVSLAQSGKRVLVIDTDLRRPRVHRAFGVAGGRGVTSVIVGQKDLMSVVQSTDVPNLYVLPSGAIPPNPSELLHSQSFAELIREATEQFDRVICDSPPLGAVTDAAVLAPQMDAALIVVKAHSTTRDALQAALRQLRDVGGNIVGSVLNDVDPRRQGYGSGEYHYYYRRDGAYYSSDEGPLDDEDDADVGGDGPTLSGRA